MNLLSTTDVINALDRAAREGGLSLSRSTFEQSILPVMADNGDAVKIGHGRGGKWAIDGSTLWQWSLYIETRARLIVAGKWSAKRPYSLADMEDIALTGLYEDYQEAK